MMHRFVLTVLAAWSLSAALGAIPVRANDSAVDAAAESLEDVQPEPKTAPTRKLTLEELSPEDRVILKKGEISRGRHITGGIVGTLIGFGIGQAIEGRYGETGWIFTIADAAAFGVMIAGGVSMGDSCNSSSGSKSCFGVGGGLFALGYLTALGFRVWQAVDAWTGPSIHNDRYHLLKDELDGKKTGSVSFGILPQPDRIAAGVQIRF